METPENVTAAGRATPSPFRHPPTPAAGPARVGASSLAPRPTPAPPVTRAPTAAAAPSSTALTVKQPQLAHRRRLGARWFYWVAGVSLVNTLVALAGQPRRFIIGLGTTQVANALALRTGRGWPSALLLDLVLIGGFVLLGHLALQGQLWAFAVGIAVYALDGLVFLAARNWIGLGFHVFVLVMVVKGFQAASQLDAGRTL